MKFKITASSITYYTLEIEAENEDKAFEIAQDADGSEFDEVPFSDDWRIIDIQEIEG